MSKVCGICLKKKLDNGNASYFGLPSDGRKDAWMEVINSCHEEPYSRRPINVCANHFESYMFAGPTGAKLGFNAVPSLNVENVFVRGTTAQNNGNTKAPAVKKNFVVPQGHMGQMGRPIPLPKNVSMVKLPAATSKGSLASTAPQNRVQMGQNSAVATKMNSLNNLPGITFTRIPTKNSSALPAANAQAGKATENKMLDRLPGITYTRTVPKDLVIQPRQVQTVKTSQYPIKNLNLYQVKAVPKVLLPPTNADLSIIPLRHGQSGNTSNVTFKNIGRDPSPDVSLVRIVPKEPPILPRRVQMEKPREPPSKTSIIEIVPIAVPEDPKDALVSNASENISVISEYERSYSEKACDDSSENSAFEIIPISVPEDPEDSNDTSAHSDPVQTNAEKPSELTSKSSIIGISPVPISKLREEQPNPVVSNNTSVVSVSDRAKVATDLLSGNIDIELIPFFEDSIDSVDSGFPRNACELDPVGSVESLSFQNCPADRKESIVLVESKDSILPKNPTHPKDNSLDAEKMDLEYNTDKKRPAPFLLNSTLKPVIDQTSKESDFEINLEFSPDESIEGGDNICYVYKIVPLKLLEGSDECSDKKPLIYRCDF